MDFGIATVTGWSALRAVVDALFAVIAGAAIAGELRRSPLGGRRVLWMLVLTTILAPDLIAGYAFSNFSLSLIRDPAWNEAFLTLLIGVKATAVAAVMLYFTPAPPLTPAGRHLLRLAGDRVSLPDRWRIIGRGRLIRMLPALAVAFLFAFQQFELPSLTAAKAWTVTLFDRQALVPDPATSAASLVWPVTVELLALGPLLLFVLGATASRRHAVPPVQGRCAERASAWFIALIAAALTAIVPCGLLVFEAVPGLGYVLAGTPTALSYWREIAVALGYGAASALAAYLSAVGLLRLVTSHRRLGVIALALACVPGLCGPLVPSLFAVALLQTPWLLPLRDTLLPLVVVLALSLLPRAVLLESLARLVRDSTAISLARKLRMSPDGDQRRAGRLLLWELDGFGRFCRVSLLAYWGYLDLTAATILAPPAVVPVTARLYNLMHYGHNASLSAMALVAVAVPAFAFAASLAARRLILRMAVR